MLIYVKIIKKIMLHYLCLKKKKDNGKKITQFMLIYVKIIKKKCFYQDGRTDRRTHVQLKTIVRNLTKHIKHRCVLGKLF